MRDVCSDFTALKHIKCCKMSEVTFEFRSCPLQHMFRHFLTAAARWQHGHVPHERRTRDKKGQGLHRIAVRLGWLSASFNPDSPQPIQLSPFESTAGSLSSYLRRWSNEDRVAGSGLDQREHILVLWCSRPGTILLNSSEGKTNKPVLLYLAVSLCPNILCPNPT